jgi:hypothetical protein
MAVPSLVWAQGEDLQRALDKPVSINIEAAPITEVFERLGEQTGVQFILDPDTLALLPYGAQTRLKVTMTNATLRKALTPTLKSPGLLAPQGLAWRVDGNAVRIIPSDALYRLGRRATYEELTVLGTVYSSRIEPVDKAGPVIEQLRKITDIPELRLVLHNPEDAEKAIATANKALPATAAQWLDALTHGRGWTWLVRDDDLVVLERRAQVIRQLATRVSIKYENADLSTVLLDLARMARVTLRMEPGVLNSVPPAARDNFNLTMSDASVTQALEMVSGATGLQFTPTNEGIRVEATQEATPTTGPATRQRARFFVRLTIPGPDGTNIEVFMRPEELPPDVLKIVETEKEKMIENLRATTQPAE